MSTRILGLLVIASVGYVAYVFPWSVVPAVAHAVHCPSTRFHDRQESRLIMMEGNDPESRTYQLWESIHRAKRLEHMVASVLSLIGMIVLVPASLFGIWYLTDVVGKLTQKHLG